MMIDVEKELEAVIKEAITTALNIIYVFNNRIDVYDTLDTNLKDLRKLTRNYIVLMGWHK